MSEPAWRLHRDAAQMADAVASVVATLTRERIAAQGHALLALPGGRTPLPIFERLANCPIDWTRTTLLPTDERLVAQAHPLSNVALLQGHFGATGARIVSLVTEAQADYRSAGDLADAALQALPWPPDLVWLGVGGDGHTASIFPGPDLQAALAVPSARRALGVRPEPLPAEAPVARVTLTLVALCAARRLLLTFTGEAKRAVVERALRGEPHDSPIGCVLRQTQTAVDIHWSP